MRDQTKGEALGTLALIVFFGAVLGLTLLCNGCGDMDLWKGTRETRCKDYAGRDTWHSAYAGPTVLTVTDHSVTARVPLHNPETGDATANVRCEFVYDQVYSAGYNERNGVIVCPNSTKYVEIMSPGSMEGFSLFEAICAVRWD
ncbi:MAG: hypothetical protein ACYTEQ_19715 [Planctomycetota bacterium]|jgi:hypothetical protein